MKRTRRNRLPSIRVHHALESPRQNVGADRQGKDENGRIEALQVEDHLKELGATQQNGGGIERHEKENDQPCENLDETALQTSSQEFREGVCAEAMAHPPRRLAQKDEGNEDSDGDV